MTNLPVPFRRDLTNLRRLTMQEILDAFYEQRQLFGFYIHTVGTELIPIEDMAMGVSPGLSGVTLVHAETGIEISMERSGSIRITPP